MSGAVMGYPVFNAAVTIHPDMCFVAGTATTPAAMRAAAASATTRAVRDAAPVMLEPHMTVVVSVHERSVGDVLNDLTSQRRARIQEVAPTNLPGRSNVIASVPLAEMIGTATRVSWRVVVEVWELTMMVLASFTGYATSLRSMTAGEGSFSMDFASYEQVDSGELARIKDHGLW